nr:reverse transcriptase domain-containing protein [Tanacetum cinerariifolium]
MELGPKPMRAATPPFRVTSPRIRRLGKEQWTSKKLKAERKAGSKEILKGEAPMYAFPNVPVYTNPNLTGVVLNPMGSVIPFVRWIEDYPLPDGLKMPSHKCSYDGKGDPDNLLRLLEEDIRMQKWLMLVACHMFTYTLKDSARIWWNSQKAELKQQIEEAVKSGQLAHLVKGVKEKKEKTTGIRSEERKKEENKPTLNKVTVLMIREKDRNMKKRHADRGRIGEIAFPPFLNVGSSDPIIIKVYISGRQVNRAYLDRGSSCEVIYEHSFLKLKLSIRSLRVDSDTPLVGFSREQSWPFGEIPLEVTIGEGPIAVTKTLTFVIVKSDSPHNLLLGRTAMQQMGIVVSTVHGAIKFHTPREPTKQRKRNLAPERNKAIHSQVEELTKTRILQEVKYQTWISDPMLVKKDNGKRKLRVDFININKACIREPHPLPASEQKAKGLHKYRLKCFMDAYKGYHLILIAEEDEEKTSRRRNILGPSHYEARRSLSENERMLRVISNDGHTDKGRNSNNVPHSLRRKEKSGRIAKWAIELGEHEIEFKGRNSIKEKILADFLVETLLTENREAKNEEVKRKEPKHENAWKLFTDGALSSNGSGAGLMMVSSEGKEYTYTLRFEFETTNNEAEYEALLAGLRIAKEMEIRELIIFVDSQLVANQVKGLFESRQ